MQIPRHIGALSEKLGYSFHHTERLQRALTHRSFSSEHNERLEFLGDSILDCVISRYLFDSFPHLSEGELSRLRSSLVREETLATLARRLGLGECLQLGEGELRSGGRERASTLADALEAVFGAVFMDGGFEDAGKAILGLYVPYLGEIDIATLGKDPKTLLQEYLQGKKIPLPVYNVIATHGEAHAQSFQVECAIPALKMVTQGTGTSRRSAEQQAAEAAYRQLTGRP